MSGVKTWKAGTADEAWHVIVCARDASRATDLLQGLGYILLDVGFASDDQIAAGLSELSGKQIADGLLAYRESNIQAVRNALPKKEVQN